jgi:hypothetical protein
MSYRNNGLEIRNQSILSAKVGKPLMGFFNIFIIMQLKDLSGLQGKL